MQEDRRSSRARQPRPRYSSNAAATTEPGFHKIDSTEYKRQLEAGRSLKPVQFGGSRRADSGAPLLTLKKSIPFLAPDKAGSDAAVGARRVQGTKVQGRSRAGVDRQARTTKARSRSRGR